MMETRVLLAKKNDIFFVVVVGVSIIVMMVLRICKPTK